MKMRNKGKVHPSPSSSAASSAVSPSPSFSTTTKDVLSVLKLLPAAILTLASVLSLQDKEVLAYMITRSLKTTINPFLEDKSKKSSPPNSKNNRNVSHRPPMFDCECFDCYTSYWSKWNSSSNRELIHQAIEAFEEHLSSNNPEVSSSSGKNKGRNKKRERMGRRVPENIQENGSQIQEPSPEIQESSPEKPECEKGSSGNADVEVEERVVEAAPPVTTAAGGGGSGCGSSHKGLARKVLPDVLGLFNSRLWSLWGPNV